MVKPYKIVIVGAGPAGMMAAIRASKFQKDVLLIEKSPILGKKLLLSGKGRCNLTNACDLDSFLKRFSKNGEFLRDSFKKFFNHDLMEFFKKRGLGLKTERQQRVFPVTDKSKSILSVLKNELQKNKVRIIYQSRLGDILVKEKKVTGLLLDNARFIPADKIILATGGTSYAWTGSTGEGIEIARKLGHRIAPLRQGLVPLEIKERYPKVLEGLTLKNIRLKFILGINQKQEIISEIGELLFTGFGISGPLVLTLSGRIVDWQDKGERIFVEIDLKPGLSKEHLEAKFLREFEGLPNKSFKNILNGLLPKRLVDCFFEALDINPLKKANQVTRQERENTIFLLKAFKLEIVGARPQDEAMITRGGICLKDINPRTMESRIISGFYFAGEMIDVDADTGGFNLQAAFSTGYLAGESAALYPVN
ncbi:MAG: NAD(P)/FAD-dependent oxidoreductase [Candidatus Omnitrophota bacterium]|nr:NAD(P)/FAD-dependent oxidoreductase [Candidatus Omnitrophota bacterium]